MAFPQEIFPPVVQAALLVLRLAALLQVLLQALPVHRLALAARLQVVLVAAATLTTAVQSTA